MKSDRDLGKKLSLRVGKKAPLYAASDKRGDFAGAVGAAGVEAAIIGFDRDGEPAAALVSIDAVKLLAGRVDEVAPARRGKIRALAQVFLDNALKTPAPDKKRAPAAGRHKAKRA